MISARHLSLTLGFGLLVGLLLLMAFTGSDAVMQASQAPALAAAGEIQGGGCTELLSPTEIPSPGLIHFDDLPDGVAIGNSYQASHGVVFEDNDLTRALVYGNEPTEAQSPPNVGINDAVSGTSSGVPMRIFFDTPKSHVGMWIGNGETAQLPALLTAYDVTGGFICQVRNLPVPEPHTEFIGLFDPQAGIASVTLDYGQTILSESIDDLYFAPFTPPGGPSPTPTRTPLPTWTPVPTASPTPGPTPTATPLVYAGPIFQIEPVIIPPGFLIPDLSIHGIEITQGIQCFDTSNGLAGCPDNSLPVVNKKDAASRIYLKYNGLIGNSMNNVPVRLHIRANNVWYVANASGKATKVLDQSKTDSAEIYFNVNFTNDVVVDFYAIVDPDNTIVESDESNNRYPANGFITLTFRKRDTLKIVGQRLRYHPPGYSGDQYAGGWAVNGGAGDYFEQLLPLRNNGINYSVKSGYLNWTGSLGSGDGQHDLIQYLNLRWILENALAWLFGTGAFTGADHVYGWAPNDGYSGGHADMPVYPHAGGLGVVGIGTDRPGTSTDNPGGGALILAHELLHDYDLKHTDTGADDCGSNDSSSAYPYSTSSIQEFGYNPFTGKIYNPASTHDVMSYCPAGGSKEGWISPYTWNYMSSELDALAPATASGAGAFVRLGMENLQPGGSDQSLVVHATIYNPDHPDYDPDQPGELGDLYRIDAGLVYPLPQGDYAIQLVRGDTLLYTETFTVTFESEYDPLASSHPGGPLDEPPFPPDPTRQADVTLIIPWVNYANEILLLHGDQVLAAMPVSLDAPQVSITSPIGPVVWPAGSLQTIDWSGSDPNGDPLAYSLMYSHDGGGSWELLANGLTDPSYEVEVDSLAGGSDVRFRVVATDGVNTAYAETPDAISVPDKAPYVTILEPVDGKIFQPGALVVLKGSATDLEDGSLPEEALEWSSDRQGGLGTGTSVPLNSLEKGVHIITLTATDSLGIGTSQSVTVFVGYGAYLPTVTR